MSLETRIVQAIEGIAQEFKHAYSEIGALGSLSTTAKTNLVAAINELQASVVTSGYDFHTADFQSVKDELLSGSDPEYDTLQKLYNQLVNRQTALNDILTNLGGTVRFDVGQSVTAEQKTTANSNIGSLALTDVGNFEADLAQAFLNGLL